MSVRSRFLAWTAAAVTLVAALAGCSSSTDGHPAATTTLNHTVTATATVTATSTVTATATATAAPPDFGNFLRQWSGHTRSVYLTKGGVMTEFVNDGCCTLALVLVLQLTDPTGTSASASAHAEVVASYSSDGTGPKNGTTGTVTIANGIMTDSVDHVIYCDQANPAVTGQCGA